MNGGKPTRTTNLERIGTEEFRERIVWRRGGFYMIKIYVVEDFF